MSWFLSIGMYWIIPTITKYISHVAPAVLQEPILRGDGTGSAPDLREKLRMLELENQALKQEKHDLEYQLSQLNSEMQNMKITCEGANAPPDGQNQEEVSEEAVRKRLERLCKRNSQGILGSILFLYTIYIYIILYIGKSL